MLTLIVFGSLQACNLIYLKHGMVTAAYEATLELAKRNATNDSVTARAQQVLDARGISSGRIRILPAGLDVSAAAFGDEVQIDVSAPVRPNITLSSFFPLPSRVSSRLTATR